MKATGVCVGILALAGAIACVQTADAKGRCTSLQARCAVKIGGTCDPATGHWVYGKYGVNGSNKGGAFDACIAAGLRAKK